MDEESEEEDLGNLSRNLSPGGETRKRKRKRNSAIINVKQTRSKELDPLVESIASEVQQSKVAFCCGGACVAPAFQIVYKDQDKWNCLELPTQSAESIQQLVSVCNEASFGKDGQEVHDPTYRKALKLDPSEFVSKLHPSDFGIIGVVEKFLAPTSKNLKVELYKLNVYRPGDFFKPHIDTPREGLIASLVVVLPTSHTGGELVVKHKNQSRTFDVKNDETDRIHWVAFFSDCEHEVKPVTSGFRITLTYNLYAVQDESDAQPGGLLYERFSSLKARADLYPEGALLGFPCQHSYPFLLDDEERSPNEMGSMLKGADAMLLAAAKAAGFEAQVRPIWKHDKELTRCYVGHEFTGFSLFDECYVGEGEDKIFEVLKKDRRKAVIWCGDILDWKVGSVAACYGNQPSTTACYCAAAILVQVPPRDKPPSTNTSKPPSTKTSRPPSTRKKGKSKY